jgi:Gpi18-like mannosyltransferase
VELGLFMMNLRLPFKDRILGRFSVLRKHKLLNLLFVGLALRFALAPFTSHPYDVEVLYVVTNDLLAGLNVYTTNSFTYPPLWAYVEFPALRLASFFASPRLLGVQVSTLSLPVEYWKLPPVITSPLFNVLCKLPLITADALIGIITYNVVKELRNEKYARLSFILWFFNPLVIYIDSVHGQFDVLPALMTVLSFCLFCRRKYFASGIAIGLGALFKIYPVLLTPLYLTSIATLETTKLETQAANLKKIFINWFKFGAGVLISLGMFLAPLINSNIIHDIFSRTVATTLGGLSIFNVAYCPGFEWLLPFIANHIRLVSISLTVLLLAVTILISLITLFSRKDFLEGFILGHIAILLVTYLTSLTVNPQYILWILPFLTLSYGLFKRNLRKLILLSASALIFSIGLTGPLYYFYPLAIFTPLLSVRTVYANVYLFEQTSGWVILLVSGILGVAILVLCLRETVLSLLGKEKRSNSSSSSKKDKLLNYYHLPKKYRWSLIDPSRVLALTVVVLLVGQFLAFMPSLTRQSVSFTILDLSRHENRIRVNYSVRSDSYPIDMQIFGTPITSASGRPADKDVFIYYDEAYPSSFVGRFVGRERWVGLLDHAPVELGLRGYNGPIEVVDAGELRNIMVTDNDSVIIIPSGVFPDTVHPSNKSLVGDWLRSGGTLIWMGDAFGYLSGHKDGSMELFSEDNYSKIQNQILGFELFNESSEVERYASISSSFSSALDLQYTDALVGALVSNVLKFGGIVLGKVTGSENARASISYLPVGSGHLILFGGGIGRAFTANGEDVIAHDIAQILCSGFPFASGESAFNLHELDRDEVRQASLDVPLPQSQNVTGIMISAFSKSPYSRFFSRQFCPIGDS